MSLTQPVASDHQLARLLQIGIVLEEVVEARSAKHAEETGEKHEQAVLDLLEHAETESAEHRRQLEALIDDLEADTVPFEEIEMLVEAQYEADEDFDGVLYDQLCNEETAYKFYDDLIDAIEASDVTFTIDRERLLAVLSDIREDEAEGVEDVTDLMEDYQ
ncbi:MULTISPECIES: ferritin-like domain-containing protein [Haloarcula]|uniref:Rubrerythrin n=3 Tax=Haloarcula TaxID=2237 RepID=A0A830EJX1_9EURY|nr:ferritin-like domain-containing protein [Haloarcula sebkhae]NLV13760.1 ferritin-like domain-containing protein [Haloarcula argentinensis]GGK52764.1 rubrerythrin [Haloarcula sebkhae]